jgi:hypothetical protein
VNCKEATDRISRFASNREFKLLQRASRGDRSLALEAFGVEGVTVRVRKAMYTDEASTGIEIQRTKREVSYGRSNRRARLQLRR